MVSASDIGRPPAAGDLITTHDIRVAMNASARAAAPKTKTGNNRGDDMTRRSIGNPIGGSFGKAEDTNDGFGFADHSETGGVMKFGRTACVSRGFGRLAGRPDAARDTTPPERV